MGQHRVSRAYKLSYVILFLVVLFGVLAVAFHMQVSKHMAEICEYKGRETATQVVNKAIETQLSENTQYINICYDSNGKITSIETDTTKVNSLQNKVKSAVNSELSEVDDKKMSIPMGTLSGVTLLSGRGPNVSLKLHQVGAVETEIKSEFVSAGVNQTKHRMSIIVTVEMSAILPLHSTDIKISQECLISETIIVGEVPQAYLQGNK